MTWEFNNHGYAEFSADACDVSDDLIMESPGCLLMAFSEAELQHWFCVSRAHTSCHDLLFAADAEWVSPSTVHAIRRVPESPIRTVGREWRGCVNAPRWPEGRHEKARDMDRTQSEVWTWRAVALPQELDLRL